MSRRGARGGKGGSEPRGRVRLREVQVLDLHLEGRSQHQIAAAVGVSQPAVSKILRRLEERSLADVAMRIERQRARHTMRLEFIYAESLRAWRTSQQDVTRRRQRKAEGSSGGGGSIAELVSENRHGDPRFLEEARKALSDLRSLWGVDAPERLAIDPLTPFSSLSDEALEAELARHRRMLDQVPPAGPTMPTAVENKHDDE